MKKRFLSLLLTAAMCVGLVGSVSAAETGDAAGGGVTTAFDAAPEVRQTLNFNLDWKFNLGEVADGQKKELDDSAWRSLTLPHDYSIEQDFQQGIDVGSGALPGGVGWYRKTFVLPADTAGKRISLSFGGVYMDSTTYVNGTMVGNYPYGYSTFAYDITDLVVADGVTENVVAVRVNNQLPSSRWYSGSGIYRNVDLVVTEPVHVGRYGTFVTTPDLETEYAKGQAVVNVKTKVENDGAADVSAVVKSTIYDAAGDVFQATAATEAQAVAKGAVTEFEQNITTVKPALWGVETPNLYTLVTEVEVGGSVVDRYETTFGFRWVEMTSNEGFYLNNEYMKLNGVCMHHDQGALGAAASYRAIERQMQMMKEMGVNSIRVCHNPAADELLEICNKLGLLVIDEAFDCWETNKRANDYHRFFNKAATHPDAEPGETWAEFDIKNMVERGKNEPCVIMWSIGNEIVSASVETAQNLHNWVKEVDTTRPTTQGYNNFIGSFGDDYMKKVAEVTDVAGFNYGEMGNNPSYDQAHNVEYPDWVIAGTETSSAVRSRGYYERDNAKHIISSYDDGATVGWGSSMEHAWQMNRDRKWLLGEYMWTGFDYIGEPSPLGSWPSKSSYFGAVDTAGIRKDAFYMYQSVWTSVEENPMVHLMPHWNWDGDAGYDIRDSEGRIKVQAYTNAPAVELFLNGESLGKRVFEQMKTSDGRLYQELNGHIYLEWMVPYTPGELKAVAYDTEDNVIATDVIKTSGTPAQIRLTPDREVITADGLDLSYILVEILDANGNLVPTATDLVNFQISGNGFIAGVDNGNQTAVDERYKDNKRKAFSGKAMVIVQSTTEAGPISLTATGAGLSTAKTMVFTSPGGSDEKVLLGYQAIPGVETVLNTQPTLPGVEAVYSDNSKETRKVTWDAISSEQLSQPGQFTVEGTVNGTSVRVSVVVTVVAIIGIKDVSIATPMGVIPTLPDQATAVYNTSGTELVDVTWDRALTGDDVAQAGTVIIQGTVTGVTQRAKAIVRMMEPEMVDKDVALREGVYPKATASMEQTNGNNPASGINDGNNPYIGGSKAFCWIPWGNNEADEWCQLEFEEPVTTHKVGVEFWWDHSDAWMCMPDTLTVQYSDDGETWHDVANQSIKNEADMREEQINFITFDEITTRYIRFALHDEAKKSPGISEVHVYVDESVIRPHTTAALESITVDGAALEGFAEDTYSYTVDLPFGAEVPEVTAVAKDDATLFIIPAMDADKATVITVTSEDGRTTKKYTIQFHTAAPALDTAEISLESSALTEDDVKPITLVAKLQDGTVLSDGVLEVSWAVGDKAIADVKEGKVYAYNEGTTTIQATVIHQGVTLTSNTLTLTIAKSTEIKTITGYEKVTVVTDKGLEPQLPDSVLATFDKGLSKPVHVIWDSIPAEKYAGYGEFTVEGSVEGQALKPTATVLVKGIVGVQQFSAATPVRFAPILPAKAAVYFSDGTSDELPVTWDPCTNADFDTDGKIVTLAGTVGNVTRAAGAALTTGITVRVSADTTTPTEPFTMYKNGFYLPLPFASYTNHGAAGNGVEKIYDNITTSNTISNDPGQNCWNNWVNVGRAEDFVGIVFGYEEVVQKTIDNLNVYFYSDSGIEAPASYEIQYYTGEAFEKTDLPQDPENNLDAGHFLSDEENWTSVTGLRAPETLKTHEKTEFAFDAVSTCAIRIKMTAQQGKSLGIIEMQAYDKLVSDVGSAAALTGIELDGTALDGFNKDTMRYTCELGEDEPIPAVTATADSNAAVTIVAADANDEAKIVVTAEDGIVSKTYTVRFTRNATPPVEDRYTLTVVGGKITSADASGSYPEGTEITVAANSAPVGQHFKAWTAEGLTLADAAADPITITMPDHDVTLTAAFEHTVCDVTSVAALNNVKVTYGTDKAEVIKKLPDGVTVTLDNNDTVKLAVTDWTSETYDGETAGSYVFTGTLTLTEGVTNSKDLTAAVTVVVGAQDEVAVVTADPVPDTYAEAQSVSLTSATEGAAIYYTTDGTEPDDTSELYEEPITVTETTTIKAFAAKEDMADSAVSAFTYTINLPPVVDTSSIDAAVARANEAKDGIEIGTDAESMDSGVKFVTQAERDALNAAIAAAETAKDIVKSTAEAEAAAALLNNATDAFQAAIKTGTYEEPHYIPPSNTTTKTEKNEDGSTTKTVTNKKTGAVTETTTYPDGTKIVAATPKDGETTIEVTVPKSKENVIVTIPTSERPKPGEVAVVVKEDGTKEILKTSIATEDGMRVLLSESCKLEIVDNSRAFTDVASDHWAADAVQFAASRELFTGTGADTFSPAAGMTRGMLMTVLARLDGQDTTAGDTWYSAGMEWAKERGISDGSAPEAEITRESLAVMLYRYAGNPEVDESRRVKDAAPYGEFADVNSVSGWAGDAMLWAVESGILQGSGNKLNPGGTATRAEVAAMLQRFISKAQ